ncbi:POP1-domain-containing protein [Mucor ambiguus]|uniref:POP1-domain-containing protein n=1 Tax=Mucor ambiguus TaxID=91626 RepID=A0A0C9MML6_9FUNG|nr:POP1-domain-containing protein [Mucor ambiguus]
MSSEANNLSGKQKRRERNKSVREIGKHNKLDNKLADDIPKVSGPIEANRYALARIMEINDMQHAIKKASYALNELAFQSLPRGLRRRAASHNINRLPARLRAKAAKEAYSSAPNSKLIRKKVKKIKTPRNTVEEFLRRQKSKKWLETHMWHAKRMKMKDIWGYRIASRPNTKSVRITYRSFTRLSVAHDASYMACIELKGAQSDIVTVLDTLTDKGAPSVGSQRFIRGNRLGTTNLYEYKGYPTKLICPISFLWKPKTNDTIWLWIHPSATHEALTFINIAIKETHVAHVELNDLRNEILKFELTGPRSTALLQAILDPVPDTNLRGNAVWTDLSQLRSSCSLSPGSVLGLLVQDPRLKFPQKVPPRNNDISPEEQRKIQELLAHLPADAADTAIWDKDIRKSLFDKKISDYGLNLRREQNMIPGTKLEPTAEDSQIPLLLIQRGGPCFNTSDIAQKPLSSHELIEGWTVIIPRGFGLAFWKSLTFAGARVAGYDDVRAMHFESGVPCFPHDYPGTRAFEVQRQLTKKAAELVWSKRPPGKRVNFSKRGIEHPFESAFETLSTAEHMQLEPEHNLAVRPHYSLICGERFVSSFLAPGVTSDAFLTKIGMGGHHLDLDGTLVKIRLKYIDRGKPAAHALIYAMQHQQDYDKCTFHIRHQSPLVKSKRKLKELMEANAKDAKQITCDIPPKSQHIGYITNGDFALSLGYGFGIGACAVAGLKKLKEIDEAQKRSLKLMVLVRNPTSLEVRPAQLEVLC